MGTDVFHIALFFRDFFLSFYQVFVSGAMAGSLRSLQTDKRPPSSMERKERLNPSPLGTRPLADFVFFKTLIVGFRFFKGFQAGNLPL